MKIIVITSLTTLKNDLTSVILLIKELEQMKKTGIQFKLFYPFSTESHFLKIVKRIFRRALLDEGPIVDEYSGITVEKLGIKHTILEALSNGLLIYHAEGYYDAKKV